MLLSFLYYHINLEIKIVFSAKNIENQANVCYHKFMNTYFEHELSYKGISFYLGDNPAIREREIHSYHEIILYMGNNAEFLTEEGRREIKHNTLIIIPKEKYHFFRLSGNQYFPRMKISISESVIKNIPLTQLVSDIKIINNPSESMLFLLNKLMSSLKEKTSESNSFYAHSVLMLILAELDRLSNEDINKMTESNRLFSDLADYINENLASPLDVKTLSQKMHTSPSNITHAFKKEFGITLHRYIIQKRLSLARRLINEGNQPSKIYSDTGFLDYSSFYKAYVKFFGHPPSREKG